MARWRACPAQSSQRGPALPTPPSIPPAQINLRRGWHCAICPFLAACLRSLGAGQPLSHRFQKSFVFFYESSVCVCGRCVQHLRQRAAWLWRQRQLYHASTPRCLPSVIASSAWVHPRGRTVPGLRRTHAGLHAHLRRKHVQSSHAHPCMHIGVESTSKAATRTLAYMHTFMHSYLHIYTHCMYYTCCLHTHTLSYTYMCNMRACMRACMPDKPHLGAHAHACAYAAGTHKGRGGKLTCTCANPPNPAATAGLPLLTPARVSSSLRPPLQVCVCLCVCVRVILCVYVFVPYTYIHTYAYTYRHSRLRARRAGWAARILGMEC